MSKADFGLILVTDRALSGGRPLEKIVEAAVAGGVTAVQLREKEASTREFIALGRRVAEILRPRRIPLIINDRVDVALAVLADGVHLGTTDMSPADARAIMGPRAIIGFSVESGGAQTGAGERARSGMMVGPVAAGERELRKAGPAGGASETPEKAAVEADRFDVDYLGVSPVFATPTKTDAGAAWGVEGLWRLRPLVRLPLVAIGGINASNAAKVLEAGADGLAVVSAICAAADPEAAARELRAILDRARAKRGGRGQGGG